MVSRLKRLFAGGSAGNEQLTLALASLLIVLLAVEGATILRINSLLTVHAFVGMLLIPVVGLKAALLALGQTEGTFVGLHKASFVVWVGAFSLHVLAHLLRLPRLWRLRPPGLVSRVGLIAASVIAGAALATATLPGADQLQDQASAHIGFGER